MNQQTADLFDGIFDNRATGQREIWQDGRLSRFCRKNAIVPHAVWEDMREPWGTYPDLPQNAAASSESMA